MAGATLEFIPARSPEAINIKPGSYTKIRIDEEQDDQSDSSSSEIDDNSTDGTSISDSENQDSEDDSDEESDESEDQVPQFYDLGENPTDRGSKKGSRIHKSWDVSARGPLGLENRGVTCYMNSAIQALIHVPAIARYLSDVAKGKHRTVIKPNSVTMELANLHKKLTEAKKKRVFPKGMISRLDDINCMMSEWEQEDSHEYYMSLMSRLQEDSVPRGQKLDTSIIHDIFAGSLNQEVVCKSCQAVSTTHQEFYDLSVGITKDHNIESSIKEFFSIELIKPKGKEGYQCEKCKKITKAYKVSTIKNAPEYLTVALKRFKFEGDEGKKMQDPVSFPLTLDMTTYSAEKEPLEYKLVGAIVHEGRTVSSGHYVALCRQPNNDWAEYDDDMVRKISEKSVLKHTDAYILVYSRLTQKPNKASARAGAKAGAKASPKASAKTSRKRKAAPIATAAKKSKHDPAQRVNKLDAKRQASEEIDNLFKKPCKV